MTSHLPRKTRSVARSNDAIRSLAHQIGTLVAIERNRKGLTQTSLGAKCGIVQPQISLLENGDHISPSVTDAHIDSLFSELKLSSNPKLANFIKWWRDNV